MLKGIRAPGVFPLAAAPCAMLFEGEGHDFLAAGSDEHATPVTATSPAAATSPSDGHEPRRDPSGDYAQIMDPHHPRPHATRPTEATRPAEATRPTAARRPAEAPGRLP